MLILLNSTKTMGHGASRPAGLSATKPRQSDAAAELAAGLTRLRRSELIRFMDLSEKLADAAQAMIATWGTSGAPRIPALSAFTGLVFKYVDASTLTADQWRAAQKKLRILSGLYGVLRPLDLIESYRLEMGCRYRPPGARNLVDYWRSGVTGVLARDAGRWPAVLDLASQEYMKAVDGRRLRQPVISPVFKERRGDGTLKTAPVHAKMARGAMVRYALVNDVHCPRDLLEFGELGWEPDCEPPATGEWLFTRPVPE